MNFRFLAGTCCLLALMFVLPAAALPDIGNLSGEVRTGTVWVTVSGVNGTGVPESKFVSYSVGTVSEVAPAEIQLDGRTGVATVTVKEFGGDRSYMLVTKNNDGNLSYAVNSISVAAEGNPLLVNSMNFGAVPATANYYADAVPAGKQHEWIDLDWKDPSQDLGLTVYAPDETFGPYSDTADGRKDGRIFLDFGSMLNVTPGHWFFKVQNSNLDYTPYTLNTYSA